MMKKNNRKKRSGRAVTAALTVLLSVLIAAAALLCVKTVMEIRKDKTIVEAAQAGPSAGERAADQAGATGQNGGPHASPAPRNRPEAASPETAEAAAGQERSSLPIPLKLLFIGNSYTLNSLTYTPFLLQEILPTVSVTIGVTYYPGASIAQYNAFFDGDEPVIAYEKCPAGADRWEERRSGTTLRAVLGDEDWDVICFNQASKSAKNTDGDFSAENGLIRKVSGYHGQLWGKPLRIGWLMPQLRWETRDRISYEDLTGYVGGILANTPAEFAIPCGAAIERARNIPRLNAAGDAEYPGEETGYGHLTYDANGHLQDGLPVLLSSYVTALSVASLSGQPHYGITGNKLRPDDAWLAAHRIPTRHGAAVALTEENCALAQQLALSAFLHPFENSQ